MSTSEIILARSYVRANGHTSLELVKVPSRQGKGQYYIAVNGRCQDAREALTQSEAQAWYDGAPYKLGAFA